MSRSRSVVDPPVYKEWSLDVSCALKKKCKCEVDFVIKKKQTKVPHLVVTQKIHHSRPHDSSLLTQLIATDARHSFDPRPVVGHPHVDARHVRIGAADAVRNGSDQRPATVVTFHHQRTATVALCSPDEPIK